MKRTFAVVALLAALGVLFKLSKKELPERPGARSDSSPVIATANTAAGADPEAALLARYPRPTDRELAERVLRRYRQTALAIERTDGLRGLTLLDRLDLEAIFLYEKHPNDFRRLSESLTDDAAADLLLHWREYFGLKRADDTDRGILIAEIGRLTPSQRRIASRYPSALPLLLVDPAAVAELIERWSGDPKDLEDALVILDFVSLDRGAADLRAALRTIDDHGTVALDAFRQQGLGGFALASLYGPVLHALSDAMPLDQTLILLRVNSDYVDELLQTHPAETVAGHLRHVAAAGLIDAVGGSPHALRLVVEFGERGEKALTEAGADAADVVYDDYSEPTLRNQAVEALAEHGTMALAMLDKYATDPDFREILRSYGAAIIPPIAQTDSGPETLAYLRSKSKRSFTESMAASVLFLSGDNGQATIKTIKKDGLERVAELNSSELKFYQFLPMYDLLHLGRVLGHGQAPTSGEMTWALVDGCFVIVDALSLVALQPEGVVAAEAARAELRTASREVVKGIGREAVQEGTESAGRALARRAIEQGVETSTERLSRWWTVRLAGGTYRVLRRLPEALPRLSIAEIADLGRPLCAKAGFRLTTWAPLRLLKDGQEILLRIPPERGLKYLGVQAVQAGVGVVAFHKMEEHLASRRPQNRAE
ncbi:hypothetical protein [Singulisphaera acidiphila]|uniref:Uncharacterized protein n=1 Tax=Singulisphaera acidiphila (strain ATCC BAA-1392 / DSM 18658 / VKM B-2454 / MOB10) TaxID=886293 RepID=L0DQW8_SINAD|nr:hypothetical protein [Singulisphaera acidiphila]AGA31403.1 hypothetical protein Sinac_7364 [Singulisphaera acidiphila DSM 18658]